MVLQQAIFKLEDNLSNQSILNTLKDLNNFTNNNKMLIIIVKKYNEIIYFYSDLCELEDLKEEITDFNFNQKKVNEMINSLDDGEVISINCFIY